MLLALHALHRSAPHRPCSTACMLHQLMHPDESPLPYYLPPKARMGAGAACHDEPRCAWVVDSWTRCNRHVGPRATISSTHCSVLAVLAVLALVLALPCSRCPPFNLPNTPPPPPLQAASRRPSRTPEGPLLSPPRLQGPLHYISTIAGLHHPLIRWCRAAGSAQPRPWIRAIRGSPPSCLS
ncbi:hypothetical protein B0J13DRAFT_307089 [Dactylonectria estremocensis]|uniref:Uncharacterized protein n=1 Tax=Dactylonectria estremocensis TaxID=1079267 RepID=A0A9P9EX85_9HYPO|nr:hypothetical protein B0J13DRAFT_307089 [Dactylonectria estremocensis]